MKVLAVLYASSSSLECWTCEATTASECSSNGFMVDCGSDVAQPPGYNGRMIEEPFNALNYVVVRNAGVDWYGAQTACQSRGGYLFVPNSADEWSQVVAMDNMVNGGDKDAFWIGLKEYETLTADQYEVGEDGSDASSIFTSYSESEPNDKQGVEECVRMRVDGSMNDALCDHTWAGAKRLNIGMGYVCEIHTSSRRRRDTDEPQTCQLEFRTRRGAVEKIQMGCKQSLACQNNKKQNFVDWRYGKQATQCRPEAKATHSVCRQCNDNGFNALDDFSSWTRNDWRADL